MTAAAVAAASLAAGYVLFLAGLALWVSHKLTAPPRQKQKKTPAHDGLVFTAAVLTAPGGYRLRGWVTAAQGPSRGTVVMCHNYKASKQKMLPWIRFISQAGYETVAFDFNGHGESDRVRRYGGLFSQTLVDLQTVMAGLDRLPLENRSRIGLMGFSMGSVAVLGYLASHPGPSNVHAVVIDSGPPNPLIRNSRVDLLQNPVFKRLPGIGLMRLAVRRLQRFGPIPRGVQSIPGQVLDTRTPFFFIQGLKDNISAPDQSQWLYDRLARAPKIYWAVPEAHHMTILCLRRDDYQQRLVAFFDRYLADNATGQPADKTPQVENKAAGA